jgi:hypothetical protein
VSLEPGGASGEAEQNRFVRINRHSAQMLIACPVPSFEVRA